MCIVKYSAISSGSRSMVNDLRGCLALSLRQLEAASGRRGSPRDDEPGAEGPRKWRRIAGPETPAMFAFEELRSPAVRRSSRPQAPASRSWQPSLPAG